MIPLYLFRETPMDSSPRPTARPKTRPYSTDAYLRSWGFSIVARPLRGPASWRTTTGEVLAEADAVIVAKEMARLHESMA